MVWYLFIKKKTQNGRQFYDDHGHGDTNPVRHSGYVRIQGQDNGAHCFNEGLLTHILPISADRRGFGNHLLCRRSAARERGRQKNRLR